MFLLSSSSSSLLLLSLSYYCYYYYHYYYYHYHYYYNRYYAVNNIPYQCDINCASHFTLDALASRPVACCKYVTWIIYCKATACVNAAAVGNSQNSLTLRCNCVTAAAPSLPVRLCSVAWTIWMGDCVTAAAALLGPYNRDMSFGLWPTAWLLLLLYWGRMTAFCVRDYGRLRDCCCCFIGAVWLRSVFGTMADCVTAAAASLGPYDCVMLSGLWPTAWLLLLLHWGRMTALCCPDYGRLRDCCCCLIGPVWRRSVFGTMGDCVTAAAASLGPYDCAMLFGLWPTAWLLLLLHWGRMTALCCLDYGRLRDCCCCCFIGAVWLRCVVRTLGDCVTAAAASLGPYDCVMLSGLWPTAWLLLLLHWGRLTAFCVRDYGRLRDCCCCLIGAVWRRSVFGTMGDCVTAAAASLGPYDCDMLFGLWPTAWLLLLLHWGRMTALCCLDYGRLRDCCCCFIGAVWRRSVFGTMADCVTAAAASLGPYDCVLCSGLWPTAWLLLLLHWGRMTVFCVRDYGRLRDCCCCFIGAVWLRYVGWTMGDCSAWLLLLPVMCRECSPRQATTVGLMLLTSAPRPFGPKTGG